ncbi:MAG: PhpK family radical SAM P-methyltransferase [Desulfobacterales bacterium]|nr:PhpK family radical SAM P-methyltransferase [Desulfobacterales bacterium]
MENSTIDCLLIGHNETAFSDIENTVRLMGTDSGAYRDLNLNFIQVLGKPYPFADVFNMFFSRDDLFDSFGPFGTGEVLHPAIAYLGTYLNRRGFSFDYINSFQWEKEKLAEKLRQNNILTIAITTTFYVAAFPVIEVVSFIRQHNSNAKIIVGGPFVSTQVRNEDDDTIDYLFNEINAHIYVNSGQGEAALVSIIDTLKKGGSLENVPNILFKKGPGLIRTGTSEENNKLADNMVNWNLFNGTSRKFAAVRTAISCPFACAFCGFPEHAGKYQTADVELIEKELNAIASEGNVRSISFIDDTFNVPPERFKQILRMMIKNKYKFKWNSYFRCQFADEETVSLMKESGCEGVFIGIESANHEILKNMNKRADVEAYKHGLSLLNKYEIISHASFIIGFPGETSETVRDTVQFIEQEQPTFFRAQLWYCEPITPIWREKEKYMIKGSHFEWEHSTMTATEAVDIVDEIFLSIKNSVSLPSHTLDFFGLFRVLHRGMELGRCKDFIMAFNQGVKERLSQNKKEASHEVLKKLENVYFNVTETFEEPLDGAKNILNAEFDF